MRSLNLIFVLLAVLWLGGCQEKSPVELALDPSANTLELQVLPAIDTTLIVDASVDTSGVSQWEEQTYPATFVVNGVKTDLGSSSRNTFSYSRILINDKRYPITNTVNHTIGYVSLDVGAAKVNAVDMPKTYRALRTYSSFLPDQNAGPAYMLVDQDNSRVSNFNYAPGQSYRFVAAGKGVVSPFELAIQSPGEITVEEPRAGSVVFRKQDLQIRWSGQRAGSFRVIISSFNTQANVPVKPLLEMNVTESSNSLTIPAKILKALKANEDGRYLFSFISSNRSEARIPGYDQSVLVQAASIHNVLLWLK